MRIVKIIVCLLAMSVGTQLSAAADAEPSATAVMFYEIVRSGDYVRAASMFDPKELGEFRDLLRIVYENPNVSDPQQIEALFGPDITVEKLNAMSDSEFFSTFLQLIFQQLQASGSFSFDGIEVIGSVPEGDEKAHVVIRQRLGWGENSVEMMDVISMRLIEGKWKLMMKGDMKGLAAAIRQSFQNG
ncbi:MAG: hypothetical protein QNJ19_03480 [Woeseiaceae bacterium]|nr:hypothetical protein [Woeseiaceae bacterium]